LKLLSIFGSGRIYPTRILIEIPRIDIFNIDKVLSIIWAGKTPCLKKNEMNKQC